ncbi:MAG: DUF4390 domain-containing protein [Castellaniella sp.]
MTRIEWTRGLRWFFRLSLLALMLGLAGPVTARSGAGQDSVVMVAPVVRAGQLYLDVDAELDVAGDLRDIAQKGVPLYFAADVDIVRRRWWWFDKPVLQAQMGWRIVYNALTRQWRVSSGDLWLNEASFDDAMAHVRHIRSWALAEAAALEDSVDYRGRVRIRLDTSRLARPFQIDALNSSAWSLATPWKDFSFSISEDDSRP